MTIYHVKIPINTPLSYDCYKEERSAGHGGDSHPPESEVGRFGRNSVRSRTPHKTVYNLTFVNYFFLGFHLIFLD